MTSQVLRTDSSRSPRGAKAALADEVATLVYDLTRAWDARMDEAVAGLRQRMGIALTARQALAIWHLHEPLTMGDLATAMACDQSNVTGIVDRLERSGLVTREAVPADRRVRRVALSTAGAKVRTQLDGLLGAAPALARLSVGDLRQLRDLLRRTLAASTPD